MLKKAGMLTVGVTAGLLAVAPLANAGVAMDDHDDKKSSKDHDDRKKDRDGDRDKKDRDKDRDKSKDGDFGDQKGTGNIQCSAEGGDSVSTGGGSGLLDVSDVLSDNTGQLLSCNSIANNILNDNDIDVL